VLRGKARRCDRARRGRGARPRRRLRGLDNFGDLHHLVLRSPRGWLRRGTRVFLFFAGRISNC